MDFHRTRHHGGKLNKAKKGELRFPLPVGFRYEEQSRIVLDPDEEVRGAVALVFRLFRETGSAFAVVQHFAKAALRFPRRSYGGGGESKPLWGFPSPRPVPFPFQKPFLSGPYSFCPSCA